MKGYCGAQSLLLLCWCLSSDALVPPMKQHHTMTRTVAFSPSSDNMPSFGRNLVVLEAGKKKRRRRKQPKAGGADSAATESAPKAATTETKTVVEQTATAPAAKVESTPPPSAPSPIPTEIKEDVEPATEEDVADILNVASFKFEADDAITKGKCLSGALGSRFW